MLNLNLNLKLNTADLLQTANQSTQQVSGVAVVGMDIKAGSALNKEAVWQAFANGLDMVTTFPTSREEDAQQFANQAYGRKIRSFSQRAYLPRIDLFDPTVFKLSPTEAELMDPVQRLFLESAWSALEDAGYGGNRLCGSNTGVYVGYNQVGEGYDVLLKDAPEEALGLSLSGNITSFLASRISYLLDLTGPALVIDTACSSSLVALHQACKAINRKEIDGAIVGSIRIYYCPERTEESIGTSSSSERTKTFDRSADGTGGGEGVISLFLRPLKAAIQDGDHIYGVIKGICANQDGSSIGITAPNAAAQERVLTQAWEEAEINPEELSYIEAHGTATKLGDPIEVGALSAAFSRYTQKKQFCAIGASKSNFGHLDCASGLLGVVKVLLMMQHKMLPPTLHFSAPNPKIDYLGSAVYVNDRLKPWNHPSGGLTAGVSSFGLSGTNCHVVLQSYSAENKETEQSPMPCLLSLSAASKEALLRSLQDLQSHMKSHPEDSLADICYTLHVGRGQYRCRFAMVLQEPETFLSLSAEALLKPPYYYEHRLVAEEASGESGMLTASRQEKLTEQAKQFVKQGALQELCNLYLQGATPSFAGLYANQQRHVLSLPTYPFSHRRFWYQGEEVSVTQKPDVLHPCLDACILNSFGLQVYEKQISPENCMELREHRINGVCVLPGTVYVELATLIGKKHFGSMQFCMKELTFFSLLSCPDSESRTLHVIAREEQDELHISIASKAVNGSWEEHAAAILKHLSHPAPKERVDLSELLSNYQLLSEESDEEFVQLGEHWQTGQKLYVAQDSVILFSNIPFQHQKEAEAYCLYPPLLDGSMNSGLYLLDGQYLPLHYKNAFFYQQINGPVYSRISVQPQSEELKEIALFDVTLYDAEGNVVGEIEQYALKRVSNPDQFLMQEDMDSFHEIRWLPTEAFEGEHRSLNAYNAVILLSPEQRELPLVQTLRQSFGSSFLMIPDTQERPDWQDCCFVRNSREEMQQELSKPGPFSNTIFVNLLGYSPDSENTIQDMESKLLASMNWIQALSSFPGGKELVFYTYQGTCVDGSESDIYPMNQALISLCSCIESEQSDMELRLIDGDEKSNPSVLVSELETPSHKLVVSYRSNTRYTEHLLPLQTKGTPIPLSDGDTIVFAGGYGGIGLALCEEIFRIAPKANVILLSRNVSKNDTRINSLQRIQAAGFSLHLMEADITDLEQSTSVLAMIREQFGRIDGVILAAGVAGDGILLHKNWETAYQVLAPKIMGATNLDRLTQEDSLRYFLLFSSVTSAIGAPGQSDYAAANGFLDAFTYRRNLRQQRTMTINWTGWKETGMAKDHLVDWRSSLVEFVDNDEGCRLFSRALQLGVPRILLCKFQSDLPDELDRRISIPSAPQDALSKTVSAPTESERPVIYGKSPDKLTPYEENVALAWARTLHIAEVNLYDKFFEAGGNSLLASYLQKEINRIYPDALAITDVFVYSTIADMAAYISGKLEPKSVEAAPDSSEGADIEALVQQFMDGALSMEDLENLV